MYQYYCTFYQTIHSNFDLQHCVTSLTTPFSRSSTSGSYEVQYLYCIYGVVAVLAVKHCTVRYAEHCTVRCIVFFAVHRTVCCEIHAEQIHYEVEYAVQWSVG